MKPRSKVKRSRKVKPQSGLSAEHELKTMRRALRHLIASYRGDEPVEWLCQILKGAYFRPQKGRGQ
jgi:hypothetical protein